MTTNDQELPIEEELSNALDSCEVPVKRAAANVTKQPASMTTPIAEDPSFTILATLPWTFGDPMCCTRFRAEIWRDENDDIFVTYWHEPGCDVWRYVP